MPAVPPVLLKTKIITPRVDVTVRFYETLFGMTRAEEWDEPGDRGCILALPESRGEAYLEVYEGPSDSGFAGLSLQFKVADVEAFAAVAREHCECRGPEDRPWGSRYLFLTDPNGIGIVVFSGPGL